MPTTVEITGYTFQELTPQAKQQVCSTLQPDNDCYWHEFIIDNAKEDGKALGFSINDIAFSGFCSQGDGASWSGYVDMVEWLEKHKPDDVQAHIVAALIENDWAERKLKISFSSSHYTHSNTMVRNNWYWQTDTNAHLEVGMFKGASVSNLFDALPEDYADTIADEVLQSARNYADEIYKQLRDEYERMCSEEYIAELCDANEYLFNKKGELL
jgi:hypothetical protein